MRGHLRWLRRQRLPSVMPEAPLPPNEATSVEDRPGLSQASDTRPLPGDVALSPALGSAIRWAPSPGAFPARPPLGVPLTEHTGAFRVALRLRAEAHFSGSSRKMPRKGGKFWLDIPQARPAVLGRIVPLGVHVHVQTRARGHIWKQVFADVVS